MKYVIFIFGFLSANVLMKVLPINPDVGADVLIMFGMQGIGAGFVFLIMGSIGLLYKKNRFYGYVIATAIMTIFALKGGNGLV